MHELGCGSFAPMACFPQHLFAPTVPQSYEWEYFRRQSSVAQELGTFRPLWTSNPVFRRSVSPGAPRTCTRIGMARLGNSVSICRTGRTGGRAARCRSLVVKCPCVLCCSGLSRQTTFVQTCVDAKRGLPWYEAMRCRFWVAIALEISAWKPEHTSWQHGRFRAVLSRSASAAQYARAAVVLQRAGYGLTSTHSQLA